jgi:NDP-sugar pyrophosphorylase family protein
MQIVIPMSGFGERFRRAGYDVPKPLIEIEGKRIIEHVLDLFPGERDLVFVCNRDHLAEPRFGMERILREACPTGRIVGIAPHKLGPVHAVMQIAGDLDQERETLVNYCDFTNYWRFDDFKEFVKESGCAGALPAYRGFHPHSLRGGVYAFIREQGLWAYDIREKQPFTDRPMDEFASSGSYYFCSARLMQEFMRKCVDEKLDVRGEYYVSMVYKPVMDAGLPVAVYELEHFMQWGTPEDVEDYVVSSRVFRALSEGKVPPKQPGAVMIPAVGAGKRFADEGYALPKPLVPVSGRPMILQAASDLPRTDSSVFVLRRDLPGADGIGREIVAGHPGGSIVWLEKLTDGQARTCREALEAVDGSAPLTIGACDNGMIYDPERFSAELSRDDVDVLVWGFRGHPNAARKPEMFGWIDAAEDGQVRGVTVKHALANGDVKRDPIIVGAFTFKRAADFGPCFERLVARNGRVNGELYVDSMMTDALELGLRVRLFEIQGYPGWGTPDDHRVFEYWQSCFHKWPASPYSLERDRHVPEDQRASLDRRFRSFVPGRPSPRKKA